MLFLKKEEYEALHGGDTSKKLDDAEQEYVSYSPNDTYSVGQLLYHPVWDDRGEVVKKEVTSSGHHSIIVAFHRLGQRTLIESLSA
ncbi:MAG: hypothetical protein D6743_12960 [Calditrichaeota bacterium]|nr:MAG: hypothetical protein D6743_12960 [Calditrichota bacterium]